MSKNYNFSETTLLDNNLKKLANALHYWLSYIGEVAVSDILVESSLRYAMCEYLERQMKIPCLLEVEHTIFKQRYIDFVWDMSKIAADITDANELITNKESCCVLECKYVGNKTNSKSERQRVFNDICRLYYLKKKMPKAHTLFLMAGNSTDFYRKFQTANTRTKISEQKIKEIFSKQNEPTKSDFIKEQNNNDDDTISAVAKEEIENIHVASFHDWFKFEEGEMQTIESKSKINTEYYDTFRQEYAIQTKVGDTIQKDTSNTDDVIKMRSILRAISCDNTLLQNTTKFFPKSQTVAIWEIELINS